MSWRPLRILLLSLLLAACSALPATGPVEDVPAKGGGEVLPTPRATPLPEAPVAAPRVPAVSALLVLADEERAAGHNEQAAVTLERAIRIQPRDPRPWLALARVHFAMEDFGAAAQFADKAARIAGPDEGLRKQAIDLASAARGQGGPDR